MADRFLVLPDDSMIPLLDALAAARQTIDIYVFTLSNPDILAALREAVARGVGVRAVVDPAPSENAAAGHAAMRALNDANVQVRPRPSYFERVHAKSFVVDGAQALVSSINYLDDWMHTRDHGVLTTNPVMVQGIRQTFAADWAATPDDSVPAPPLVLSPANSRATLAGLIDGAQTSLILEEEQITDEAMGDLLAARSNAGVAVQIVTNALQTKNRPCLERLQARAPQAQVRYSTQLWLHTKLVIADERRMLVGSVNLTPTSLDRRREVSMLVDDPAAVARAVAVARDDFASGASEPPDPDTAPPRPADSPGGGKD
ncbi:MAG TPA: phospholipase D-like domain-containing protein [Chloroflexia bacterium]